MGHDHDHGTANLNERRLFWAGLLTAATMIAEAAGGILSGSLALLADAGHMLTDSAALALAWLAVRVGDAARPTGSAPTASTASRCSPPSPTGLRCSSSRSPSPMRRSMRLFEPVKVMGGTMLVVATAGLVVNIVTLLILRQGGRGNLNVRAALLHVMSDLLGLGRRDRRRRWSSCGRDGRRSIRCCPCSSRSSSCARPG